MTTTIDPQEPSKPPYANHSLGLPHPQPSTEEDMRKAVTLKMLAPDPTASHQRRSSAYVDGSRMNGKQVLASGIFIADASSVVTFLFPSRVVSSASFVSVLMAQLDMLAVLGAAKNAIAALNDQRRRFIAASWIQLAERRLHDPEYRAVVRGVQYTPVECYLKDIEMCPSFWAGWHNLAVYYLTSIHGFPQATGAGEG